MNASATLPQTSPTTVSLTAPNGLRIVVVHSPDSHNDAVCLTVKAGMRHELPGQQGAMHLLEHMAYQDGRYTKAQDRERALHSAGGLAGANTHMEYIEFYEFGLAGSAVAMANRLVDQVFFTAFDPQAVADQIRGVATEREHRLERAPGNVLPWPHLSGMYWTDFAHGHDGTGDLTLADRFTPGTLSELHASMFFTGNATLVAVSPTEPARLAVQLRDLVEFTPTPHTPAEPLGLAEPISEDQAKRLVDHSVSSQRAIHVTALDTQHRLGAGTIAAALRRVPGLDASAGLFGPLDIEGLDLFVIVDDTPLQIPPRDRISSVISLPPDALRAAGLRALFVLEKQLHDDLQRARTIARDLALGRGERSTVHHFQQMLALVDAPEEHQRVVARTVEELVAQSFASLTIESEETA